ncbi:MAG: hypothetical protein HY709_01500 [Candidatus Latescibacteria bacterium]|nr:hypothetical protein [Candidatus Latescibacterota bacterium]
MLLEAGANEAALLKFQEVVGQYADTEVASGAITHAAWAYSNLERYAEAVDYLEGVAVTHRADLLGQQAGFLTMPALIRQHRYAEAATRVDEIVRAYPGTYYAGHSLLAKGTLYLYGYGDRLAAHAIFQQMVAEYPEHEATAVARAYLTSEEIPAFSVLSSSSPVSEVTVSHAPNPFNPTTTIHLTLPQSTFVELTIYNALG